MPLICISPDKIEKLKEIVSTNSSISRAKRLRDLFGSDELAKEANLLYEKSLLLKNQDKALDKFLSGFTELGQQAKKEMREKIAERLANRADKIQKDELLAIAEDIWSRKYKVDIPFETVKKINNIKIQSDDLRAKMAGTVDGSDQRIAYGLKEQELTDVISGLKSPTDAMGIIDTLKSTSKDTANRFNKDKGVVGNIGEGVSLVWDVSTSAAYKAFQSSMDISYGLRQGFKVLTTNPKAWKENWLEAFKIFKTLGNKEKTEQVSRLWKARIISNDMYQTAIDSKLAVGVIEDFFPKTWAEKIPGIGNIFKASNEAFTVFSQGARMSLFEDFIKTAQSKGRELTPELLKDIATLANSITGRGSLGSLERSSSVINKIFYSGRYIKSSLDTFMMPFSNKLDPFVRAEAQKVAVKNIGTIGVLMYTASLFTDVEFDPRSSKFGKMKIPGSEDRWVDLTAGLGSYVVLTTKQALGQTKTQKGKIVELNKRDKKGNLVFGSQTRMDVGFGWVKGKFAPAPNTIAQFMEGRDYSGKKPTVPGALRRLYTPISGGNAWETIFSDDESIVKFLSVMADVNGMGTVDYSKFK